MTQQYPNAAGDADNTEDRGANLAELEAEIDQTRSAISGDLRTLGERLDPAHLKEEAKEVILEAKNAATDTLHEAKNAATSAFREVKDDAMNTVNEKVGALRENVRVAEHEALGFLRENAVPLALIGAGIGWLLTNRKGRERRWDGEYADRDDWRYSSGSEHDRLGEARQRASRLAGDAREAAYGARDRAERWVDDAGQRARGVASQARGAARQAEHRVTETAYQARDYASRELDHAREYTRHAAETHPLAVGAAAVAAGIGIGLLLPATRPEQQLLGERKERLLDDAKGAARDIAHTAQRAAREVKETLTGSSPS